MALSLRTQFLLTDSVQVPSAGRIVVGGSSSRRTGELGQSDRLESGEGDGRAGSSLTVSFGETAF